uniref:Uncharacterized protein n=1 Tax=Scophthalmus maximus TaxID=52904 RepID=A0A8D3AX75_SCOMX
ISSTEKLYNGYTKEISKMARLKLRDSDVCWRYDRSKGTLVHMLYECSMTWTLWEKITTFINKVLGTELRQDPGLCMLGIMTEGVILTSRQISTSYSLNLGEPLSYLQHQKVTRSFPI